MKKWKFDKLTEEEQAGELNRLENRIPAKPMRFGFNNQKWGFHGKAEQRKARRKKCK